MARKMELEPFGAIDVHEQITQIGRFDRLREFYEEEGRVSQADRFREAALQTGVAVIEASEKDGGTQADLKRVMRWLKRRDYEGHLIIEGILGEARAVRATTKDMMRATGRPDGLIR